MKKDRFSKAITRALVLSTAAMLGLSAGGIAAEAAQKKGETIAVNVPDLKNTRPFEGWEVFCARNYQSLLLKCKCF